jgi:hypothetical protein
LEGYYNNGIEDPASYVLTTAAQQVEEFPEIADQIMKDAELAAIMAEGYIEWLEETGADVGLKVIGAECQVEVPLGTTPYTLRGKIDTRLEREADGAWLQLEHKTVGNLTDLPKYAQSNPQFLTYDLLSYLKAQEEGDRATDGVILNMARRVKRTAKAKPPFYARHEVRHNVDELRAHFRHVVAIGREIEQVWNALDGGTSHHDVCPPAIDRNHLWYCSCAPITTMFDDGSDVESYLEDLYEDYNPFARYDEEEAA